MPERKIAYKPPDSMIAVWGLVIAAIVAVVYSAQLWMMQKTLRTDQRPWIKASFEFATMQADSPVGGTVRVLNSGKTPARNVRVDVKIDHFVNGEQPTFEYSMPYSRTTEGTLFPGDPQSWVITRQRGASNGVDVEDAPLAVPEFTDFRNFKIYFVAYGIVRYSDFFNIEHWTKFCVFTAPPGVKGAISANKCAAYSDVDAN